MSDSYYNIDTKTIDNFSAEHISELYDQGYYFGRIGKGVMTKTRLLRIVLDECELTSENRRILRKTKEIDMATSALPLENYHWSMGKMMKDFYDTKFGDNTFSANKAKEVLATQESNFNQLFAYFVDEISMEKEQCRCAIQTFSEEPHEHQENERRLNVGYSVCYENTDMIHYAYPFYHLEYPNKNIGMGMMVRALQYAKETGKTYLYLGSVQRPSDSYKLQFQGLEWFDGNCWQTDLDTLKELLKT